MARLVHRAIVICSTVPKSNLYICTAKKTVHEKSQKFLPIVPAKNIVFDKRLHLSHMLGPGYTHVGPARAARTVPVPIWPRTLQWPRTGSHVV